MEQTNTNINNKQNGMCDKSLENTLKKQNHCHGKINSFWLWFPYLWFFLLGTIIYYILAPQSKFRNVVLLLCSELFCTLSYYKLFL